MPSSVRGGVPEDFPEEVVPALGREGAAPALEAAGLSGDSPGRLRHAAGQRALPRPAQSERRARARLEWQWPEGRSETQVPKAPSWTAAGPVAAPSAPHKGPEKARVTCRGGHVPQTSLSRPQWSRLGGWTPGQLVGGRRQEGGRRGGGQGAGLGPRGL